MSLTDTAVTCCIEVLHPMLLQKTPRQTLSSAWVIGEVNVISKTWRMTLPLGCRQQGIHLYCSYCLTPSSSPCDYTLCSAVVHCVRHYQLYAIFQAAVLITSMCTNLHVLHHQRFWRHQQQSAASCLLI